MKKLDVQVGTVVTYATRSSRIFAEVTKVTPTGRFYAGAYCFNADGTVRGADTRSGPYSCRIATPEDYAKEAARKRARATNSAVLDLLGRVERTVRHARSYEYKVPEAEALLVALRAFEAQREARLAAERQAAEASRD